LQIFVNLPAFSEQASFFQVNPTPFYSVTLITSLKRKITVQL